MLSEHETIMALRAQVEDRDHTISTLQARAIDLGERVLTLQAQLLKKQEELAASMEALLTLRDEFQSNERTIQIMEGEFGPGEPGTKHALLTDANGCLAKANPMEPVFLLRGQDLLAPNLVDIWATQAKERGASMEKVLGAQRIRDAMTEWPNRKYPT